MDFYLQWLSLNIVLDAHVVCPTSTFLYLLTLLVEVQDLRPGETHY